MHLQSQNQENLLTNLINLMGKHCPIHQVLRESVINGVEANNRETTAERGKVLIAKDWEYPNKMSIINVNGEYLSEEKAKSHLITLAESGNSNGHTENFGIGAKISYLPKASQGILYRSISKDGESVKFQIMKRDDGLYGLKDFTDEDGSLTCFPELTDNGFESAFSNVSNYVNETNYGTEMVLMGDTVEEDTWHTINCAVARDKSAVGQNASGKPIHFYLAERLWEDMGNDIYVVENSEQKATNSQKNIVRKIYNLKQQMTSGFWDLEGSMDLVGEGIPKGTKVYYCSTQNKNKNSSNTSGYGASTGLRKYRYFTTFAWRKETYLDFREHHQTRIKKAKECGIYALATRFVIVFELPDNYDAEITLDRTKLTGIDENLFYTAFRENLPQDILDYLADNTNSDMSLDISTYAQEALKDMIPKNVGKSKDGIQSGSGGNTGNKTTTTKKRSKGTRTRKRNQSGWSKLSTYKIPDILSVEDETAPLIEFQVVNWRLVYNLSHPVWEFRAKRIVESYLERNGIPISEKIVEQVLAQGLVVNALRRIFETQQAYSNESKQVRESKWDSSILEACWTLESEKMLERELKKIAKKNPTLPMTTVQADDSEDSGDQIPMFDVEDLVLTDKSLISL